MPFTFSHPAIILPFIFLPHRWFSLTGLVIGSLTPDFEYFLRMEIQSNYGHRIIGVFCFDLPLGILLAFIFHNIVRNNLFDNLPIILKSRLIIFKQFDWNTYFKTYWFVIIISVLVGAISHIFWDSFTHEHGYFVQMISILTNSIEFLGQQVHIFKILQHLSTLLGGLAITIALFKLPTDKNITKQLDLKYWIIFIALTLTIITIRLLIRMDYKLYGNVIVTTISAGLISLTLTSWLQGRKKY